MKTITRGFSEAGPSCFRNPSINFWGLPQAPGRVFTGLVSNLFFKGLWIFLGELMGFFFLFRFFSFTAAGLSWRNRFFGTKRIWTWDPQQSMYGQYNEFLFLLLRYNPTCACTHPDTGPWARLCVGKAQGCKRRLRDTHSLCLVTKWVLYGQAHKDWEFNGWGMHAVL